MVYIHLNDGNITYTLCLSHCCAGITCILPEYSFLYLYKTSLILGWMENTYRVNLGSVGAGRGNWYLVLDMVPGIAGTGTGTRYQVMQVLVLALGTRYQVLQVL